MKNILLKKERFIWVFIVVFIVIIQAFCSSRGSSINDANEALYFDLFKEATAYIRAHYVDDKKIGYKNLVHGAIKGMLESLGDDHTSFLSEDDFKELNEVINNKFGGLGIYISIKDNYPTVIAPIEGTPAYQMGVKSGDRIIEIEGKSSKGMNIIEVVKKLKGKVGTKVSIKIAREDALELIPLTLTRAEIKVPTVKHKFIKKGLAYVRIVSFGKNTARDLNIALKTIKKKGLKKLIIDLRNNPGGLLNSVVKITDYFMSKGKIVYTRGRNSREDKDYYARKGNTLISKKIPIIVLVNGGSASASEILAGALQDTHRALIVGTKTFGKGSVQTIIPLFRGDDSRPRIGMRLTIQKYLTPAGRSIHKKGIEPDELVPLPKRDFEELYMLKKLQDGKYIKKLLKKHPKYTKNHVTKLMKTLKNNEIKLNRRVIEKRLRDEKRRKGIRLIDLEYDIQLKKAVELIQSGNKQLHRPIIVFN